MMAVVHALQRIMDRVNDSVNINTWYQYSGSNGWLGTGWLKMVPRWGIVMKRCTGLGVEGESF